MPRSCLRRACPGPLSFPVPHFDGVTLHSVLWRQALCHSPPCTKIQSLAGPFDSAADVSAPPRHPPYPNPRHLVQASAPSLSPVAPVTVHLLQLFMDGLCSDWSVLCSTSCKNSNSYHSCTVVTPPSRVAAASCLDSLPLDPHPHPAPQAVLCCLPDSSF